MSRVDRPQVATDCVIEPYFAEATPFLANAEVNVMRLEFKNRT